MTHPPFNDKPEGDSAHLNSSGLNHFYDV